jgi:hypothetical protein
MGTNKGCGMRITTKITIDMLTGAVLDHQWHDYWGPVEFLKGDSTDKSMENNQLAFQEQLQGIFSQQYASQTNTLNYLNSKMEAQINTGGTGYNAATLAAMRTSATDQTAAATQNAERSAQQQEFSEGGQNLPSGVNAQINAGIKTVGAQAEAGAQENITQSNAALQNQNYWQATNVLAGDAAQANPLGYAGAFNQSGSAGAAESEAYTASNQSQLLGALGGIAGGLGTAVGGYFRGQGQGQGQCHIAAALFNGWNTSKTAFIRLWLFAKAPRWFSKFYGKYAERIAPTPLRYAFLPVFEAVIRIY